MVKMTLHGYAGKILRIDLSSGHAATESTADYVDFLGGRGFGAKIYWNEVIPDITAFDPENRMIFAVGPLAGLPVLGTSRWIVCGKSPLSEPEHFNYCNMGGRWGAAMKFAGYDAIVVQGKSEQPVYLLISGDSIEFVDASYLWGRGAIETREILKRELGDTASVVAIGPAGEHLVSVASLLADNDASGSGGLGATMGSKNLKAIVVRGTERQISVAQPGLLQELIAYFRDLRRIPIFVSPHRCTVDDDPILKPRTIPGPKMRKDPCYGCLGRCPRKLYETQDGTTGKFMCDSAMFYQPLAEQRYGEWNDVPFLATKLCDDYGLDSVAMHFMISWLRVCHKAGILTDENTGIPLSKIGELEFMETLVRKVSLRDGFGDTLALGMDRAAELLGPEAQEQVRLAGYFYRPGLHLLYGPRLYPTTGLMYAMEPRIPISQLHQVDFLITKWLCWVKGIKGVEASTDVIRAIGKQFMGSELAFDFSTYQGKALAAKVIQDREYAKECLVACDMVFPIMDLEQTENHLGDPNLESKILSAVTGADVDEEGLRRIGERVFNLQRAILVREGHDGRAFDNLPDHCYTVPLEWDYFNRECLVPGKNGEVISRKGAVVDREQFESMKDEYYRMRDWNVATGLQTSTTLGRLGLNDVADDLQERGLLAQVQA